MHIWHDNNIQSFIDFPQEGVFGTFNNFLKATGARDSRTQRLKTRREASSTGIWHNSWISLKGKLQSMLPSGLSYTFFPLVTTFPWNLLEINALLVDVFCKILMETEVSLSWCRALSINLFLPFVCPSTEYCYCKVWPGAVKIPSPIFSASK